jgi:glycerate dehydrogenase
VTTPAHRVVYLERATLKATVRRPGFRHDWIEYPVTTADDVADRIADATIVVSNKLALPGAVLARAPALRLVAIAATGANHVDLDWCRAHGVGVCNVRDYSDRTLPEHVFMLLLALRRNLLAYHAAVAAGRWQAAPGFSLYGPPLQDLHGATLGIVGHGVAGQAVARLAAAFGMRVLVAERRGAAAIRAGRVPFDEVLRAADAVTLHCPLTLETANLIGAAELAAMRGNAVLVNTARGGLVDPVALARALRDGAIAGAGIDVLPEEPPASGSPLLDASLPNLIVTPHVAWASDQAQQRLADGLVDNLEAFARGEARNRIV